MTMARQKKDQRVEIRFMVKEGLRQVEVIRCMQAVHGRDCLSEASIKRWYGWFKSGQDSVDNQPKSGAPKKRTPKKLAEIRAVLQRNARSSISTIARDVNLSYGTVQKALHADLDMTKLSARWIPHLLTQPQKVRRVALARAALQMLRSCVNPIDSVIAQDESWIFAWDPESREASRQWVQKGQPRPTKCRIEQSMLKSMLVAFVDKEGVIHYEFVAAGLGIGHAVYLQILIRFREALHRKRPHLWRSGRWCLLQDGAPAHRARPVRDWFGEKRIKLLLHSGYSPDLNPMDYWFFDSVKKSVKGHHHHTLQDLHTAVKGAMDGIAAAEFRHAFDRLPARLCLCIASGGDYFVEQGQ